MKTEPIVQMDVYGRAQLAAAIRAVPHDGLVEITLHRAKGKTIYRFDFSASRSLKRWDSERTRSFLGAPVFEPHYINRRLANIARKVRALPAALFT